MICDSPALTGTDRRALWAAMATITSGLSHEMRNPLCALELRLRSLLAAEGSSMSERTRQGLTEALATTMRLGTVTDRLCSFSPVSTGGESLDPLPLICEIAEEEATKRSDIELSVEDSDLGRIHLDPADLGATLRHLIQNACDAMPGGGRLHVQAQRSRNTLQITIADTGHGIPPEILPRLGQPFVTTKAPGHGLGLGLCECLLRLERHGGCLDVTQTGPEGTTVRVSLPVEQDAPAS